MDVRTSREVGPEDGALREDRAEPRFPSKADWPARDSGAVVVLGQFDRARADAATAELIQVDIARGMFSGERGAGRGTMEVKDVLEKVRITY